MRLCKRVYDCAGVVETTWVRHVYAGLTVRWSGGCRDRALIVRATRFYILMIGCIVRLCGLCGDGATVVRATQVMHIGNRSQFDGVEDFTSAESLSVANGCNMFLGFHIILASGSCSDRPPLFRATWLEHVGGMSTSAML